MLDNVPNFDRQPAHPEANGYPGRMEPIDTFVEHIEKATVGEFSSLHGDAENIMRLQGINEWEEFVATQVSNLSKAIKGMTVSPSPANQNRAVRTAFGLAEVNLSEKLNGMKSAMLGTFDDDTNDFAEKFMKSEGLDGQKEEARERLENRLEAENKRISNLKEFEKKLLVSVEEHSFLEIRRQLCTELRRVVNDEGLLVGNGKIVLPKGVTFIPNQKKFNWLEAGVLGKWAGTFYEIDETGLNHSFHPLNKESCEYFKKSARVAGAESVDIKLGTGVSGQYQMNGSQSPRINSKLRAVALDLKFDLETGLPYKKVKRFVDGKLFRSGNTAAQLHKKFNDAFKEYNEAKEALNHSTEIDYRRINSAVSRLKDIEGEINSAFPGDYRREILTLPPVKANIEDFNLYPEELKYFKEAQKLQTTILDMDAKLLEAKIEEALESKFSREEDKETFLNDKERQFKPFVQQAREALKNVNARLESEDAQKSLAEMKKDDIKSENIPPAPPIPV